MPSTVDFMVRRDDPSQTQFATAALPSVADGDVVLAVDRYGYFPMSTHVVMQPARANPAGFSDGSTHRAELHPPYNGAVPTMFFAPDQIRKRNADWGPGGFATRFAAAWRAVLVPASDPASGWLDIEEGRGNEAVERVYRDALAGRLQPNTGNVLSLS